MRTSPGRDPSGPAPVWREDSVRTSPGRDPGGLAPARRESQAVRPPQRGRGGREGGPAWWERGGRGPALEWGRHRGPALEWGRHPDRGRKRGPASRWTRQGSGAGRTPGRTGPGSAGSARPPAGRESVLVPRSDGRECGLRREQGLRPALDKGDGEEGTAERRSGRSGRRRHGEAGEAGEAPLLR